MNTPDPAFSARQATPQPDSGLTFDRDAVLATLDGSEEYLHLLLETFLESAAADMANIRLAQASGDLAALQRFAHSLKGACGFLLVEVLHRVVAQLDAAARAGDAAAAARIFDRVESLYAQLVPLLKRELGAG